MKNFFSLLAICLSSVIFAEITLKPFDGEVPLVPQIQKDLMAYQTPQERWAVLNEDNKRPAGERKYIRARKTGERMWRQALAVVFEWSCTDGETGPFCIEVSENEDMSDLQKIFAGKRTLFSAVDYNANFKIGTKYYWRVQGFHGEGKEKQRVTSAIGTFVTEDVPPRWLAYEGRCGNFRDCGGWKTVDGRRLKQGLIFRSQGLNDNSPDEGLTPGRNRMTVSDVRYALDVLKIRTELDLRATVETAGMTESPLGPSVQYINIRGNAYHAIYSNSGKRAMANCFRVFCNPENYPITFHCIGGADRAGSLAWILKGAAGVSQHDADVDWEQTFYPSLPNCDFYNCPEWLNFPGLNDGLLKYGKEGDSFQKRVELYLMDCGITMEEIQAFRKIVLE